MYSAALEAGAQAVRHCFAITHLQVNVFGLYFQRLQNTHDNYKPVHGINIMHN
jgi:hypothetical protein